MASGLINRLSRALQKFEQTIDIIFGRGFPPGGLCVADFNHFEKQIQPVNKPGQFSLKDILNDTILWAVPKSRRTLERRLQRRFGVPEYYWKPPVKKTNILMCTTCGHDYEAGLLCGHCYERVKKETEEIQETIQKALQLEPVEQDVVVLYEGEKEQKSAEFWKNQRVVEIPKQRPSWFSQNLLESTTQEPSNSKDVKPTDLA